MRINSIGNNIRFGQIETKTAINLIADFRQGIDAEHPNSFAEQAAKNHILRAADNHDYHVAGINMEDGKYKKYMIYSHTKPLDGKEIYFSTIWDAISTAQYYKTKDETEAKEALRTQFYLENVFENPKILNELTDSNPPENKNFTALA